MRSNKRHKGDLKGHGLEITGSIVVNTAKARELVMTTPTTTATTLFNCHKKSKRPQRKRIKAS